MEENNTTSADLSLTANEKALMDAKFDMWKKKLLDLGLRNQLLNFKPQRLSNLKIDLSSGLDAVLGRQGEDAQIGTYGGGRQGQRSYALPRRLRGEATAASHNP